MGGFGAVFTIKPHKEDVGKHFHYDWYARCYFSVTNTRFESVNQVSKETMKFEQGEHFARIRKILDFFQIQQEAKVWLVDISIFWCANKNAKEI